MLEKFFLTLTRLKPSKSSGHRCPAPNETYQFSGGICGYDLDMGSFQGLDKFPDTADLEFFSF